MQPNYNENFQAACPYTNKMCIYNERRRSPRLALKAAKKRIDDAVAGRGYGVTPRFFFIEMMKANNKMAMFVHSAPLGAEIDRLMLSHFHDEMQAHFQNYEMAKTKLYETWAHIDGTKTYIKQALDNMTTAVILAGIDSDEHDDEDEHGWGCLCKCCD